MLDFNFYLSKGNKRKIKRRRFFEKKREKGGGRDRVYFLLFSYWKEESGKWREKFSLFSKTKIVRGKAETFDDYKYRG